MAAVVKTAEMTIQKNSQIIVNVEEALADLLVVSYSTQNKKFQGVLLDSNKGNLPFGVYSLHPAFTNASSNSGDKDKLHSVSQRFSYQETDYASEKIRVPKKPGPKGKQKSLQKMTVRLRPRKVLCSNCQGICNENSENVNVSKKRKLELDNNTPEVNESSQSEKNYLMRGMLIPKLSRLNPSEISSATKGTPKPDKASEKTVKCGKSSDDELQMQHEVAFVSVSDEVYERKDVKDNDVSFNSMFSSARTLKICFGEGEGTVVKIPPISGDFNEDSGVSCDMLKPTKPDSKAAKKALKKAKKQAKKNNNVQIAKSWIGQSTKHGGALSPRNNIDDQPMVDPLEKKHKHKVKHKKKHRVTKKRDENTSKSSEDTIEYFGDIKEHCLKQKLSINLRRLSSNSFERRNDQDLDDSESDEWDGEEVPDFPAIGTDTVGGRLIRVVPGDVVWGKVFGFPWWPGRVLSVKSASKAHVAWYASTTSSLMPCDSLSPFLEDYKIRFNKKKRGPYKEAVKQATIEAKRIESQIMDPLGSPVHATITSPHPIDVFS